MTGSGSVVLLRGELAMDRARRRVCVGGHLVLARAGGKEHLTLGGAEPGPQVTVAVPGGEEGASVPREPNSFGGGHSPATWPGIRVLRSPSSSQLVTG